MKQQVIVDRKEVSKLKELVNSALYPENLQSGPSYIDNYINAAKQTSSKEN